MRVKDARQTFLGVWIRLLLEGRPFEVWDGSQLRDFTFVDDAVEAFLLAASAPHAAGRAFNVGGDGPVSLKELAATLVEIAGGGDYIERPFPPERKRIDIGDYYANDDCIRQTLSWHPRTGLREGLRLTLDYYRQNLAHYV